LKINNLAISVVVVCASAAFGGNIVVNPGFETGDFTGWSNTNWNVQTADAGVVPHSGSFYADTGCAGANCISDPSLAFSQALTTVAGQNYTFSFFYDLGTSSCNACLSTIPDDPTTTLAQLVVQWNGANVLNVSANDQPNAGYVLFSVTEMATSTTSTISFSGRQDPEQLGVDDVCVDLASGSCPVTGASGVPEPGSMFLVGGGMAALALAAYARRRFNRSRILARA